MCSDWFELGQVFQQQKKTWQKTRDHHKIYALRYLIAFVEFKKREKHPWRSVNFSKVAGLLKLTLLHRCFSRFLNCANATKSRNASHIYVQNCALHLLYFCTLLVHNFENFQEAVKIFSLIYLYFIFTQTEHKMYFEKQHTHSLGTETVSLGESKSFFTHMMALNDTCDGIQQKWTSWN